MLKLLIGLLLISYVSCNCVHVNGTQLSPYCHCAGNQIRCTGKTLTNDRLKAIFSHLNNELPKYAQSFEGFELYETSVTTIDPQIFGSVVFRGFVKLNKNPIHNLSLSNFPDLVYLDLSDNQLKDINSNMFLGLRSLKYLNLAENQIVKFPKTTFNPLDAIERIDLSNNKISTLYYDTFTSEYHNNFELTDINLSNNNLTRIPEFIFWPMRRPKLIDLSHNKIHTINKDVLSLNKDVWTGDLVTIKLSSNGLTEHNFNKNSFDDYTKLKIPVTLDLSYNNITYLNQSTFSPLLKAHKTTTINLQHNPFKCLSCSNKWLLTDQILNKTHPIVLNNCSDNKNKTLWKLTSNDFKSCK